jgi:hypothetical protein
MMNTTVEPKGAQFSWLDVLKEQVTSLRYGIVQIVVHDRRVVQIERTEKFRFEKPDADLRKGSQE